MRRMLVATPGARLRPDAAQTAPFDLFLLVALGLGMLLFQPLLAKGLPQAPDAVLHFYRSVVWSDAWREGGIWWPRWHTLLYQGYGYPVFHFNGPLLYAAVSLLQCVIPNIEAAFKGMILLVCLAYPIGMYVWARDFLGRWGALVAATAYAFATYRFHELYSLGNYAQFSAWSLFPWILFFFGRLALTRGRAYFLGATVALAALLLMHNISSMLFLPVLGAWVAGLALHYRQRRPGAVLLAAAASGLGLAAIFVLPALSETGFTRVSVLTQGVYDIAENFLRPVDLVAAIQPLDERAARPLLPFTYGRLHLLLAIAGALTLFKPGLQPSRRLLVAFALAGVVISSFLMLSPSLPVWQTVPLLRFTEAPRRLYGVGFLFSSFLCGAAILWLDRLRRTRSMVACVLLCALIVAVGPFQFPRPFVTVPGTVSAYVGYETAFRAFGTTAGSEYVPPWVESVPTQPALTDDLSRVALLNPMPGQSGAILEAGPGRLRIHITQVGSSEVVVAQFYFPGWRAKVDGVLVPVRYASGSGCISLEVPQGEHEILLEFGDTPIRRAGGVISLFALVVTGFIAWRLPPTAAWHYATPEPGRRAGLGMLLVIGVLFTLKLALAGPLADMAHYASPPGTAEPAQHHTNLSIAGKVTLIGYDLERGDVHQGEKLHVRLYWQPDGLLTRDYASYVQLIVGPEHKAYAQSDHTHPGNMPTSTWTPAHYVIDDHQIPISTETPPVAYRLEAGLYAQDTGDRLGSVELPGLVYINEERPLLAAELPAFSVVHFGPIQLLGQHITAEPEVTTIALFWQASEPVPADYQVFVHAIAADGKVLAQADDAPLAGLYPTSRWLPGRIVIDLHRMELSDDSRPALTAFHVGLYDLASGARLPATRTDGSRWPNDAVVLPADLK